MSEIPIDDVARLPAPGDNVAIATRRLEAGTILRAEGETFQLTHTVMEGHRFAVRPIDRGAELLSWTLPFGVALTDIRCGEYVSNAGMLEALGGRPLDFELPAAPNFEDRITRYELDEATFAGAPPLERYAEPPLFRGFDRGIRGVGTRNHVVIMGTSSRTAAFARIVAQRLENLPAAGGFDGVVAVAHTEGGGAEIPNNRELLLRTLAGFAVHPNVGALLCVDYGSEAVSNTVLEGYLRREDYPIDELPHRFLSIEGGFDRHLAEAEGQARQWAQQLQAESRVELPASHLKLALQCGGSDAFSGVSGNPLAAWVARELIRCGGAANLAETDELIGAEPYVLDRVRDAETARRFLQMVERFKERVSWHGASAEGNPSGGNKYRGLYNIVLKSIGAAMKRHPEVPLDGCLEYGQQIPESGYWFMDSPGNDLESIAGQVASGCNIIYFVTGNGSITNFPFVPTVKIVTTSQRFELLAEDMDVNAGAYQDGTSMDEMGRQLFARTLAVAAGERTRGEAAGHSQVSIWRDWPQADAAALDRLLATSTPAGAPLTIRTESAPAVSIDAITTPTGVALDRIGLVLPTSLCSGQIARLAAQRLNHRGLEGELGLSRFSALVHTEGCGVSGGPNEDTYTRTLIGYLTHPSVALALLLEHGCEKTHNDYMRARLLDAGVDAERFGFASVQLDGGIERVLDQIEGWFRKQSADMTGPQTTGTDAGGLRLGLLAGGVVPERAARSLARLTSWIVGAGGTVVVPEGAGLAANPAFAAALDISPGLAPSLAHGEYARPGFHVMEAPTGHWTESVSGLGATGIGILLAYAGEHPLQGHPMIPMLQVTGDRGVAAAYADDLDAVVDADEGVGGQQLLDLLVETASQRLRPRLWDQGNTDFQITRGLLGVSM
ncbi:MAG TPA: altronate hydrolase [Candidatus Latescibacteria bacterium]|nr:altronate hydrolase [Candidatus Latescibacterota bacterium]